MKRFNSQVASAFATATITFNGGTVPANGAVLTIPGSTPSDFTFADTDPGGVTWVDTGSGDTATVLGILLALLPTAEYSANLNLTTITLTYLTAFNGDGGKVLTANDANVSVSGFSGGFVGGTTDGDYGNSRNFWTDGTFTANAPVPAITDDVGVDDSPLKGTGFAKTLSVTSGSPTINGASITAVSCSVQLDSGMLIVSTYTGAQNGGTVTLKPNASGDVTYTPSAYTGGAVDFATYNASINGVITIIVGPIDIAVYLPAQNRVRSPGAYGLLAELSPTLVVDQPDPSSVLAPATTGGVTGTLALVFSSAGNVKNGISRGSINAVSVGNGSYVPDFPDPTSVLPADTVDGSIGTLAVAFPATNKVQSGTSVGSINSVSQGTGTLDVSSGGGGDFILGL